MPNFNISERLLEHLARKEFEDLCIAMEACPKNSIDEIFNMIEHYAAISSKELRINMVVVYLARKIPNQAKIDEHGHFVSTILHLDIDFGIDRYYKLMTQVIKRYRRDYGICYDFLLAELMKKGVQLLIYSFLGQYELELNLNHALVNAAAYGYLELLDNLIAKFNRITNHTTNLNRVLMGLANKNSSNIIHTFISKYPEVDRLYALIGAVTLGKIELLGDLLKQSEKFPLSAEIILQANKETAMYLMLEQSALLNKTLSADHKQQFINKHFATELAITQLLFIATKNSCYTSKSLSIADVKLILNDYDIPIKIQFPDLNYIVTASKPSPIIDTISS